MNSSIERLLSLRVRDVMQTEVITVDQGATMGQAAVWIGQHDISGVPVVDESGKCVGVLSVADFARREQERAVASECFGFGFEHRVERKPNVPICNEAIQEDLVSDHMSPVVQTIRREASIMNAARVLTAEHIHRLVIVDEHVRPIGVLSSLDIVACMIAAIEE